MKMDGYYKVHEDCEMCEGQGIDLATECEEYPDTCKWCEGKGWIHWHWEKMGEEE